MATVYKRGSAKGRMGSKWIARWYDAELRKWHSKTAYTDKKASLELGVRLERESARRAEGIIDPINEHQRRPIAEHVVDFIERVKAGNRDPRYVAQLQRRIERIIEGTKTNRLHQLDPVNVDRFLSDLRHKKRALSGITRNEYVGSIRAFTSWAVAARRIAADPLASVRRAERKAITRTHPRRALTLDEVARLIAAAAKRPLVEMLTVRRGANRGKQVANLRPAPRARAELLGRERRLAYLIAVWTGLRRSEIAALRWADIDLDGALPRIRLRSEATKSRRADTLVIHRQLANELRAAQPENVAPDALVVKTVPGIRVLQADLKYAGVEYGNRTIGYADFHALRKTLSTMMAAAGMSQRVRQAHMRHTDPRLTECTYMDESLLPVAEELSRLPAIPGPGEPAPEAIPLRATGTDDSGMRVANMQQTYPTSGHCLASNGNDGGAQIGEIGSAQVASSQEKSPGLPGLVAKAGERIRTVDIHVGNVTLYR